MLVTPSREAAVPAQPTPTRAEPAAHPHAILHKWAESSLALVVVMTVLTEHLVFLTATVHAFGDRNGASVGRVGVVVCGVV